jgi:hypothetical protein
VILVRAHMADRGIGDTASSPSQYFSDPLSHSHAGGAGWVPRPGLRGHLRLQPLDRAKDRERHREHSELARTKMIFSPLSPSRFTKHISLASSPYFLLLCKLQCAPCADCLMPPSNYPQDLSPSVHAAALTHVDAVTRAGMTSPT